MYYTFSNVVKLKLVDIAKNLLLMWMWIFLNLQSILSKLWSLQLILVALNIIFMSKWSEHPWWCTILFIAFEVWIYRIEFIAYWTHWLTLSRILWAGSYVRSSVCLVWLQTKPGRLRSATKLHWTRVPGINRSSRRQRTRPNRGVETRLLDRPTDRVAN